ncbi:hypothetical protein [Andreprevotia chitinilytica]|uniref:hypothetical protein n=1 Tax=Andreprevotia chitinilytica TaxID=396808 RepID=UPI00055208FE|nr:hypothetical protein [Andreprevotia chitinilytica]
MSPALSRRTLLALLTCTLFAPMAWSADNDPITILTQQDVYNDYQHFIGTRDPLTLTRFDGDGSRRDVVELVLVQQALALGGLKRPVRLVKVDNSSDSYSRYLKEILSGNATMGGNTAWMVDLKSLEDKVFVSPPLIRQGEFEAGLYTTPDNANALAAKTLPQVQKLTAVVAESWKPDVMTLDSLKFSQVLKTQSWDSMVGMVVKHRADVLLAPFQPTADMSLEAAGHKFVPIPNVKVGLQGSRHLFVSKLAPNGNETAQALEKGLTMLREKGVIERAYKESGFFNMRTANWNRLN